MTVELLQDVRLTSPARLVFANGDALDLPAGNYWTAAFGVVVDLDAHRCIASAAAAWKINR